MNALLLSTLAFACLCGAFYLLEKSKLSSKEITLIALLSALAALARIPFAAAPGLQPTTVLILSAGFVFGPATGFFVGSIAALASNAFLGQGPWTLWQMLSWGLSGFSAGWLGAILPNGGRVILAIMAVFCGYLYGWAMNFWYWYSFISPLTLASFIAVNAASFPFDTLHAIGNAIIAFIIGGGLLETLRYFRKRLHLSYL